VRGTDNAVYQLLWTGLSWYAQSVGGVCTSGPSATYSSPNRLDVFCRGSDLALWQRTWTSTAGWAPAWTRIESKIISDPEAVSTGTNERPQVFVRGVDRRLYQFRWDGSTWESTTWGVS
jgi:hypothetical protein